MTERAELDSEGVLFRGWVPGALDGGVWHADPLESTRMRVLEYLWADEVAHTTPDGLRVPTSAIFDLEPWERDALGLPEPDRGVKVRLVSDSYPGQEAFSITAVLEDAEEGRLLLPRGRMGPWLDFSTGPRLVSKEVHRVLAEVDAKPSASRDAQLLWVGNVRAAALEVGAGLDDFLANEEIVVPGGFTVRVSGDGSDQLEVDVIPQGLPDDITEEVIEGFANQRGPVASSFTVRKGGRRIRVVLGEEERRAAGEVRQRRVLKGRDVPRFLANPEAFLPDLLDLTRFSPRVRGLIPQRYVSQPYVRIEKQDRRDWFAVSTEIDFVPEVGGLELEGPPGLKGDAGSAPGRRPKIDPEEYAELCKQAAETGERHFSVGRDWIEIDPDAARRYLEALARTERGEDGELLLHRSQVGMILDVISNLQDLEFDAEIETPEKALLKELPEYDLPKSLIAQLMPHQVVGYRWLRYLAEERFGGLLADDMGLGKTVQLIALLGHLLDEGTLKPALIVAPLTLLENWSRELRRFCPRVGDIYIHQGPQRSRSPLVLRAADVVLCTYDTLRRDQLMLAEVDWSVIACDEAQYVKNPTAQVTSSVKGMKARQRVALTGTPVENGLSELWCIVDFVQPGRLMSHKEFRTEFERPIRQALDDPDRRHGLVYRLQERLNPHFLRRTKEEILDGLPGKTLLRQGAPLSDRQKDLYRRTIARVQSGASNALEALNTLIVACSHPEAVEPGGASVRELLADCPKLQITMDILRGIQAKGEKAVLFTRYRAVQDLLQSVIMDQLSFFPHILNGDSLAQHRMGIVDRFSARSGFGVMILSPQAAGVGLNITEANHVIHYTRLWNPARENQATDRVHRIGQVREVIVHLPIVEGGDFLTVEEHLDALLQSKADLARDVLWSRDGLDLEKDLRARVFAGAAAE